MGSEVGAAVVCGLCICWPVVCLCPSVSVFLVRKIFAKMC